MVDCSGDNFRLDAVGCDLKVGGGDMPTRCDASSLKMDMMMKLEIWSDCYRGYVVN